MKSAILILSILLTLIFTLVFVDRRTPIIDLPTKRDHLLTDSIPELHRAVSSGNIEKVTSLLQNNIDIMSLDFNGETALMHACKSKNIDFSMFQILLEYESDLLYRNSKNQNSAISICT